MNNKDTNNRNKKKSCYREGRGGKKRGSSEKRERERRDAVVKRNLSLTYRESWKNKPMSHHNLQYAYAYICV